LISTNALASQSLIKVVVVSIVLLLLRKQQKTIN